MNISMRKTSQSFDSIIDSDEIILTETNININNNSLKNIINVKTNTKSKINNDINQIKYIPTTRSLYYNPEMNMSTGLNEMYYNNDYSDICRCITLIFILSLGITFLIIYKRSN